MTNLTEKLDELQVQMAAEHTALLAKLDALNGNLSQLAYLPMLYEDIIYYMGAWNDAIANNIPARLNTLSAYLSSLDITLTQFHNMILTEADERTVAWAQLTDIHTTIGLKSPGAEFTLASLVRAIATATANNATSTGILGAAAPGTILDLLALLPKTDPCGCGRAAPGELDCTAPYASDGQTLLPWTLIGGTSQMFASFPDPPPTGLEFGTVFGFGTDRNELESSDWSQWRVFVQSTGATYSDGSTAFDRFPTNEWRTLSGSGSRAFAVGEREDIFVTLCRVADFSSTPIAPGECITFSADEARGPKQAVTVGGYANTYTISATDNFYIYYGEVYGGGPFSAGTPWPFSEFASQPVTLEFGSSTADPVVDITICNPTEP